MIKVVKVLIHKWGWLSKLTLSHHHLIVPNHLILLLHGLLLLVLLSFGHFLRAQTLISKIVLLIILWCLPIPLMLFYFCIFLKIFLIYRHLLLHYSALDKDFVLSI